MAQLGFSPAEEVWLLAVSQAGSRKPEAGSREPGAGSRDRVDALCWQVQMFTFDRAQSKSVAALLGRRVVVDTFGNHNRSSSYLMVLLLIEASFPTVGGLFR